VRRLVTRVRVFFLTRPAEEVSPPRQYHWNTVIAFFFTLPGLVTANAYQFCKLGPRGPHPIKGPLDARNTYSL
jgi:hypothetical protein